MIAFYILDFPNLTCRTNEPPSKTMYIFTHINESTDPSGQIGMIALTCLLKCI